MVHAYRGWRSRGASKASAAHARTVMSCRASLKLETPNTTFTSGDVIAGTATVTLDKDMDIEEVVVKLRGRMMVRVRHRRNDRWVTSVRNVDTLWAAQPVFPPEHLRRGGMKEYTMKRGFYEFPFAIQVPGHETGPALLPNLDTWHGKIWHTVKVTVRRASNWKASTRVEVPIGVLPCVDAQLLSNSPLSESRGSVSLVRKRELILGGRHPKLEALLQTPDYGANPRHGLGVALALRRDYLIKDTVRVTRLRVVLLRHEHFRYSMYHQHQTHTRIKLADQAVNYEVPFKENTVDVSHLLAQVALPLNTVPSFRSNYIDISYQVLITLEVEMGKASRGLDVGGGLVVQSPMVHQHAGPVSLPLTFQVPSL